MRINRGLSINTGIISIAMIATGYIAAQEPFSSGTFLPFFFCSCLFVAGVLKLWRDRNGELPPKEIVTVFDGNMLAFPKGYYFKQSVADNKLIITAARISEINLTNWPSSFVLDDREIIFVPNKYHDILKLFAEENNIPVARRPDIWELLTSPLFDDEMTAAAKEQHMRTLIENGLPEKEVKAIRRKVWLCAFIYLYYGMMNDPLSMYDYLRITFRTRKKYWWAMDIALRNYRKKI